MQTYTVNGKEISFSTHKFEGKKSYEYYEKAIYLALKKIGVTGEYVSVKKIGEGVKVIWGINGSQFSFHCNSQLESRLNMGAVSQAIQEDVRQILRGIKDLNLVMKQYSEEGELDLRDKRRTLSQFANGYEEEYKVNFQEKFPTTFSSTIEAKETIEKIKNKYSNFTNLSLLPEDDKKSLRQAYLYLGIAVKF